MFRKETMRKVTVVIAAGLVVVAGAIAVPQIASAASPTQSAQRASSATGQPAEGQPAERWHAEGRGGPGPQAGLERLAVAAGVSAADLVDAFRSGESFAEFAAANGIDVEAVAETLQAEVYERIDAAVADGHLSADDASRMKERVGSHITEMLSSDGPLPCPGPRAFDRQGREHGAAGVGMMDRQHGPDGFPMMRPEQRADGGGPGAGPDPFSGPAGR